MDYLELSLENLHLENIKLAKKIEVSYCPDIVVYIAKGGYLIGKDIADYFEVPCIGIHAEREGNAFKSKAAGLLRKMPRFLTKFLRELELNSGLHNTVKERKVYWDLSNSFDENLEKSHHVLLVDDSVDTGYSMKQVVPFIQAQASPNVEIRLAAINVWQKSINVVQTDFYVYEDVILATPMSNDSSYHKKFLELYDNRYNQ